MKNASTPNRQALPARAVADRYGGTTLRTVLRWELTGQIPPHNFKIAGRKYWWLDALEAHERSLVATPAVAER
jgi:hypothetical protein